QTAVVPSPRCPSHSHCMDTLARLRILGFSSRTNLVHPTTRVGTVPQTFRVVPASPSCPSQSHCILCPSSMFMDALCSLAHLKNPSFGSWTTFTDNFVRERW